MKRTVIELLHQAVENYGDKPFLAEKGDEGWKSLSFREANSHSDWFASGLLNIGIGKDSKISVLAESRPSWIIGEYGILKSGGISVPLSVKLLPEEILFRINHSESKAIIASLQTYEKILQIWPKIEAKDFKLIILDNEVDVVKEKMQKAGLSTELLITYNRLIDEGRKCWHDNEKELDDIYDGISEDDTVTISYTSGTTGNPKGIMLTHLNYWSNTLDALKDFKLTSGMRLLVLLPIDHSFAHVVGIYISLKCPIEVYFVDSRGSALNAIKNIAINLKEVKPDFILTVPAISGNFMKKISDAFAEKGGFAYKLFKAGMKAGNTMFGNGYNKANCLVYALNYPIYKLADKLLFTKAREMFGGNLKFCVGGGALLDVSQQNFFYSLGAPVYQGYGLTEATPIISVNCEHTHKLGTSGKVLSGITCKILKQDGSEAAVGEKGEIVIKGLNVMKGYYKNEAETEKTVRNGWLYTGDMGFIDSDGFLVVTGREKALLIAIDGEKYSPESIEEAIINSNSLVPQVMIHNDHNRYTTAICTIDKTKTQKLIREKNIRDPRELLRLITDAFFQFKHTKEYANSFPEKWIPSTFRIVYEPFSEQNAMVNSTMKMVRYKIVETYKPLIDEMNSSEGTKLDNQQNLNVLKRIIDEAVVN
jgi:long-chain acyl-CoA synthetase